MQARKKSGQRPRISVSLDPEDFDWVESLPGASASLSYKLSRLVKAARINGLTLDEAQSSGTLEEFHEWLKSQKRKSKTATDLQEILSKYLSE